MKPVKCLLFVIGMFCITGVKAQVNLRLDSVIIGISSTTINRDSSYTLFLTIANDSATGFNGVINIGGSINNQDVTDTSNTAPFYYANHATLDTIPPLSHITRPVILNTHNLSYVIGTSGVVIWPIAVSTLQQLRVTISDSLSETFTVLNPASIDEITDRKLKVYMNGQQLIIENGGQYALKGVQLYDVEGRLVQEQPVSRSGAVDMSRCASGVYFATVTFADETRAVVKVVNTR